ncbi:MAG: hypothetical protein J0H01_02660 [Rhizobiales bacterium]|nr:hypothetical protein [Hyphomicrobiales bacterium]
MAIKSRRLAPPHSQFHIADRSATGRDVPREFSPDRQINAASGYIIIGVLPDCDGPTTVSIGAADEIEPETELACDRVLDTPTHIVRVFTTDRRTILVQSVPSGHTRVRIWVNDRKWADKVVIGLG